MQIETYASCESLVFGSLASDTQAKYQACLGILQGGFFNCTPLNLVKSQSLYKIAYSNFFSPILLLGLGLRQIQGGTVKKPPCSVSSIPSLGKLFNSGPKPATQ